ncbi:MULTISPECIES: PhoH family protein [Vitreoscilla]|uniref:PhoH-like protein n=1 Tax=Vitreoscilla stercoraria TaxID=61 RepID=A0ABY4EAK9_VITST|nr:MULTISPECIES: PhoH family protein [Vitreoscilla]AUZ05823.1 PhoH-like protein [Vitreoscilla sp. C1]UOO92800.1 PhoH family protein [Vitreoscilla stercoraria]
MSMSTTFSLTGETQITLQRLSGAMDAHFEILGKTLNVEIRRGADELLVRGDAAELAVSCLQQLLSLAQQRDLNDSDIQLVIVAAKAQSTTEMIPNQWIENQRSQQEQRESNPYSFKTRRGQLSGRTPRQNGYIKALLNHDVVFGLGPAGTGKTYLAVAAAVDAMERHLVNRIVLVRPAVEAGEKLGFLPGDLTQKVDPYLRPLYDALYELMGFDRVSKLLEKGLIEIAPLAYMRGRTLNSAYVILDEAQNTTPEQMKMFLTRIGFGAKAVITGDLSQIDLPRHIKSGLRDARDKLSQVDGLYFHTFTSEDVVRHPLVQKIVEAYDQAADTDQQTHPSASKSGR